MKNEVIKDSWQLERTVIGPNAISEGFEGQAFLWWLEPKSVGPKVTACLRRKLLLLMTDPQGRQEPFRMGKGLQNWETIKWLCYGERPVGFRDTPKDQSWFQAPGVLHS